MHKNPLTGIFKKSVRLFFGVHGAKVVNISYPTMGLAHHDNTYCTGTVALLTGIHGSKVQLFCLRHPNIFLTA